MHTLLWFFLSCSSETQDTGIASTEAPPPLEVDEQIPSEEDTSALDADSDGYIPEIPSDPTQVEEDPDEDTGVPQIDMLMQEVDETRIIAEEIDNVIKKEGIQVKAEASPTRRVERPREGIHNYYFDQNSARIYIRTTKDNTSLGARLMYDHVILAQDWTGQVLWNDSDHRNCLFEFQVPILLLDVDPPELRKELKMDSIISDADREEVKAHMLSSSQLWADKHPFASFSSTKCKVTEENLELKGEIRIRGVSRKVTTNFLLDHKDKFVMEGTIRIKHSDFDMLPYSSMMGMFQNQDLMTIYIRLDSTEI